MRTGVGRQAYIRKVLTEEKKQATERAARYSNFKPKRLTQALFYEREYAPTEHSLHPHRL
jgi:hypothetical protein